MSDINVFRSSLGEGCYSSRAVIVLILYINHYATLSLSLSLSLSLVNLCLTFVYIIYNIPVARSNFLFTTMECNLECRARTTENNYFVRPLSPSHIYPSNLSNFLLLQPSPPFIASFSFIRTEERLCKHRPR